MPTGHLHMQAFHVLLEGKITDFSNQVQFTIMSGEVQKIAITV